jgi:hypothetical protein
MEKLNNQTLSFLNNKQASKHGNQTFEPIFKRQLHEQIFAKSAFEIPVRKKSRN